MRFQNTDLLRLLYPASLVHGPNFQDVSASCLLKNCCSRRFSTQKRVIQYHPCSQSYGTERLSDLKKRLKVMSSITGLKHSHRMEKYRKSERYGSHRTWLIR